MTKHTHSFLLTLFMALCSPLSVFGGGIGIIEDASGGPGYLLVLKSEVAVSVNDQIAQVMGTQLFVNQTSTAKKIKYAFPLPEGASATGLRYFRDGQWTAASFSTAAQDTTLPGTGNGPSSDPNLDGYLGVNPLFFQLEALLPAGDSVMFELSYVMLLPYQFGEVSFSYKNDYTPFQIGNAVEQILEFQLISQRDLVSIGLQGPSGNVSQTTNAATITVNTNTTAATEDYLITYELDSDDLGVFPISTFLPDSVLSCDTENTGFLGLIIEPDPSEVVVIDKVFTLVIDRSGSMNGQKMMDARDAAQFIVQNLNQGDMFNIVDFSSTVQSFQPTHVAFDAGTESQALNYLNSLSAGGGTNISGALTSAIDQFATADSNTANIIIFLTDGRATSGVTSTSGILAEVSNSIAANETEIYLFTFGIGTNVDQQLLSQLAAQNNGLSAFLGNADLLATITDFYLTIQNPVLLSPTLTVSPDVLVEVFPHPLPNLYQGQQLLLMARYDSAQTIDLDLTGQAFGQTITYNYTVNLADSAIPANQFLPKIWAQQKIGSLTQQYYQQTAGSAMADSLFEVIQDLSVCYEVTSAFTSFTDPGNGGTTNIAEWEEELETNLFTIKASPTPANGALTLTLDVYGWAQGSVEIQIFNMQGQLIKVLQLDLSGPGTYQVEWDGTATDNQPVAPGVYLVKTEIDGKTFTGKIVQR